MIIGNNLSYPVSVASTQMFLILINSEISFLRNIAIHTGSALASHGICNIIDSYLEKGGYVDLVSGVILPTPQYQPELRGNR
ncbi:hypothetical protein D5P88_24525 [Salmonella enterica subsp. enterica]|nr:hypothetical protein [Salmonella enterica subsp. enterica]ECR9218908.1 hypothetical protein [Salmonella enterica]